MALQPRPWTTHADEHANAPFAAAAVVILLAASMMAALAPTLGPRGGGPHGIEAALEEVRSALALALDGATADAVRAAARAPVCDVETLLDAALCARLAPCFPLDAGGWVVTLATSRGGLTIVPGPSGAEGSAAPRAVASARATVVLARDVDGGDGGGDRLRAEVCAWGTDADVPLATALASRALGALDDDAGPLAYALRTQLWQIAQGRALAGELAGPRLLSRDEVEAALGAALASLGGGELPPPPASPAVDLVTLVSRSLEGALDATVGCWDDYLGLREALAIALLAAGIEVPERALELAWPSDRLGRAVARVLERMVMGALAGAMGDLPTIDGGGGLSSTVSASLDALDELSRRLEEGVRADAATPHAAASEVVRAAMEGLLDGMRAPGAVQGLAGVLLDILERAAVEGAWPFGPMAAAAAGGLAACALAAARLGVSSAREALLAVAAQGAEVVTGAPPAAAGEAARATIEVRDLAIEMGWEGTSACEPGGLVAVLMAGVMAGAGGSEGGGAGPSFGALPYVSRCRLRLAGDARVATTLAGSAAEVPVSWTGRLDLVLEVPVATGWPLEGVAYAPSRTLAKDLAGAASAVWDGVRGGLGQLACRVRDAGEWVASQLAALGRDVLDNVLSQSAYTLSRSLFTIAQSLVDGAVDRALNASWDLLSRLAGDAVRERLTWRFGALGLDVETFLDPFAQRAGVTVSRGHVTASLEVERLAEKRPPFRPRPVDGFHWGLFGRAAIDLGQQRVVVELDPLTLERACALTATASWGDDGRGGPAQELVVEAVGAYRTLVETGVRLSSLLGVGGIGGIGGVVGPGGAAMSLMGGVGMVDAGVVMRSDRGAPDDMAALGLAALKRAWLGCVRGVTVGALAEGLSRPPDAGAFAEALMRELYFAILEEASGIVRELEAFVEVDPPAPGWPRVHVGLVVTRPLEVLLPLAAWARLYVARLAGAGASASVAGAGSGLRAAVAEHVLLRLELGWSVRLPPALAGGRAPPEVGLVVRTEANLAALQAAVGGGEGGWEASVTVALRGVSAGALSVVPGLCPASWGRVDVVLLRVLLRDASAPRLLISQVHYDADGRDSDLEYVQLLNAGGRVVDAGGLLLQDDAGTFELPAHTLVWPGGRLLVVRDRAAAREEWGVHPEVSGMGLRLANDGDVVRLVGPQGSVLDEVAWEGFVPGWEHVCALEGEALVRAGGDLRWSEPDAWSASSPCPGGGGGPL